MIPDLYTLADAAAGMSPVSSPLSDSRKKELSALAMKALLHTGETPQMMLESFVRGPYYPGPQPILQRQVVTPLTVWSEETLFHPGVRTAVQHSAKKARHTSANKENSGGSHQIRGMGCSLIRTSGMKRVEGKDTIHLRLIPDGNRGFTLMKIDSKASPVLKRTPSSLEGSSDGEAPTVKHR